MMCKVIIPGEAVAQGRPRFVRATGRAIDPEKSRNYKAYVRLMAARTAPETPVSGEVALSIEIYRRVPKSVSKRKREGMLAGEIPPLTRPDCSNIAKGIEDALNGLWYKDDSQITKLTVSKKYGVDDYVVVQMEAD